MTEDDRTNADAASSTPSLTSGEADELLGAYVLDALDADERAALEAYLERNPAARREADRLHAAFDEVVASQAVPAPTSLWDRIAAELPEREPAAAVAAPVDELAARRLAHDARRTRPGRLVAIASVAAAIVLIAGIALGRTTTSSDDGDLAAQLRATASRTAEQPGARKGVLSGAGGTARVVVDGDGLAIVDTALPRLADGQSYQLWAVDGAAPVSLGLLGATSTVTVVHLGTARGLAITVEPAAGSTQPTSTPVLTGRIA